MARFLLCLIQMVVWIVDVLYLTIGGKQGKITSETMPNPNDHFDTAKRAAAYENATRQLAHLVGQIKMPAGFESKYNAVNMVYKFRTAFQLPELRHSVLAGKYEHQRIQNAQFSAGFCGVASYAWNHMFRMPNGVEIWKLKQTFNLYDIYGIPNHVWMENVAGGQILDLTFDQFVDADGKNIEFPYEMGVPASADISFPRGYEFGRYLGIDLEKLVLINALKSIRRK